MSTEDNNTSTDVSLFDIDTQQFYLAQFWIFLVLIIPSIICALFGLFHFLMDRNLRQALNNHIIIILLFINLFYNFTDITLFIHYFHTFEFFSSTPSFRLAWGYMDYEFFVLQFTLFAWATIERHILIFHDQLVATRRRRLFFHYLPPIIITVYCLMYYGLVFFAVQCENNFDNYALPSFIPCAFENDALAMYDTVAHVILPNFIVVSSSIVLLLRVLWQRYRTHTQIHWRRHRKIIIQVLSISCIYLIFPFPYALIVVLQLCGVSSYIETKILSHVAYFTYYTLLLFPIVSIGSLPELKKKLEKVLPFRRQRRVVQPEILPMVATTINRVVIQ